MTGESQQVRVAFVTTANRLNTTAALRSTWSVAVFGTVLNAVLAPLLGIAPDPRRQTVIPEAALLVVFVLFSLAAGRIATRAGHRVTGVLGLAAAILGSLLLIRSGGTPPTPVPILALVLGAALVHVSANLAVARPGVTRSLHLDLVQGFFSAGAAAGPWMYGFLQMGERAGAAAAMRKAPYLAAAAVFGAAALFALRLTSQSAAAKPSSRDGSTVVSWPSLRVSPLQSAAIFCCTGAEMAMACLLVSFCMQPETGGMSLPIAAGYLPLYWAGIILGRQAGTALLGIVPAGFIVGCVSVTACLLVTTTIGSSGSMSISSFMLAGTSISMLFPGILSLAVAGLFRVPGGGMGLLFPALAGGGIVPIAEWALADRIGLHAALVIPAICCLYLMFYGFVGPDGSETAHRAT